MVGVKNLKSWVHRFVSVCLVLPAAVAVAAEHATRPDQPNVILILADDLG